MLDQLVKVLTLTPQGDDRFLGDNMHPQGFRVYGGQVLAQVITAAQATVDDDRPLHSQHAYFLSEGDASAPIEFEVERARDGGSISSRRVVALQSGRPVLVSSMSFMREGGESHDHQPDMPEVPPPEALANERQLALEREDLDESFMIATGEDLDVRPVDPIDFRNLRQRPPGLQAWMKTNGTLPGDPGLHRAMLAYLSDLMLIDACMVVHPDAYWKKEGQIASLDHALWFHGDFRADEWLLHTVDVERVAGGRGLALGRFYTRDGVLVATAVQQGLIRFR